MKASPGMEQFSRLEDKVYLTFEFAKRLRDEKEQFERERLELRQSISDALAEKKIAEDKLETLLSERDSIQLKIEAMLDAFTLIDEDVAAAVGR